MRSYPSPANSIVAPQYAAKANTPGRTQQVNGNLDLDVISHELGHNMGIGHAGVLTQNGQVSAYGDPFDGMGIVDAFPLYTSVSHTFVGMFFRLGF